MIRELLVTIAIAAPISLLACPSRYTPVPVAPIADADAAPFALGDGPQTPCSAACGRIQSWGCWTIASCPATMSELETDRAIRMPNGYPMTCAAVVAAPSLASVGLTCDAGAP